MMSSAHLWPGSAGKSLRRVGDHRRDAGPALHVVGEPADGIAVGLSRCLAGAKRRPPAHRLLAREADLGKRDVIVGRQILLHDFLHDVLPDANAKPQLADLPAGRARFEFVTDVAKTERALRVGRLRIEHDLERLRNVRDDDVQVGDPDIMLINDETDSGGRHGVGPRLCEAAMQVVRDPPTAGDAHRASESTDALQATSLLRADCLRALPNDHADAMGKSLHRSIAGRRGDFAPETGERHLRAEGFLPA